MQNIVESITFNIKEGLEPVSDEQLDKFIAQVKESAQNSSSFEIESFWVSKNNLSDEIIAKYCSDNTLIKNFLSRMRGLYRRPAMYIGSIKIDEFQAFNMGYLQACRDAKTLESNEFLNFYSDFSQWFYHRFLGKAYSPRGVELTLHLLCKKDSLRAIRKYCELLFLYVEKKTASNDFPFPFELFEYGFSKYQATGNDFIIVERSSLGDLSTESIKKLCDRKLGIGADGLIIITDAYEEGEDFEMIYYNADGRKGSICGNGGRAALAHTYNNQYLYWSYWDKEQCKHLQKDQAVFRFNDQRYHGSLHEKGYALRMTEPTTVQLLEEGVYFTDTGSPHVVILVDSEEKLNDESYFRTITHKYRYDSRFEAGGGTNVNLLFRSEEGLQMRTFERGVEDETLSCGTGTVAVTAVMRHLGMMNDLFTIETKGGTLYVEWDGNIPTLIGPAVCVFTGKLSL